MCVFVYVCVCSDVGRRFKYRQSSLLPKFGKVALEEKMAGLLHDSAGQTNWDVARPVKSPLSWLLFPHPYRALMAQCVC